MISEIIGDAIVPKRSRLFCPVEKTVPKIFISLVDYRNNYFTSNDTSKIIDFYEGFENRDQLIKWMKERPKGVANIHEVEGDKDIIVVITTADFNGKYAKECRENIFKGSHMVFVESGGREDFYFNFAHNVNTGIRKASEYEPKWVIISNDDMEKVNSLSKLREELNKIYDTTDKIILAKGKGFHSRLIKIGYRTIFTKFLKYIGNNATILKIENAIEGKYGKLIGIDRYYSIHTFFTSSIYKVRNPASFFILSRSTLLKFNSELYDETYINGFEDVDVILTKFFNNYVFIKYGINDYEGVGGQSMGRSNSMRFIRDIINKIYSTYKLENGYFKPMRKLR